MLTEKKINKGTLLNVAAFVVLFAVLAIIDATSESYDMIVKVLQKVCVYSIVAVSMNLLNGFTGLFSLGQAGFMLLGAYTCAIFIIPTEMSEEDVNRLVRLLCSVPSAPENRLPPSNCRTVPLSQAAHPICSVLPLRCCSMP